LVCKCGLGTKKIHTPLWGFVVRNKREAEGIPLRTFTLQPIRPKGTCCREITA